MTQEEKSLLLKDLCARLPYLVRCTYPNDIGLHIPITEINIHDDGLVGIHGRVYNLYDIKPYLRPMSSMTEEERNEYTDIKKGECNGCILTGKGDPDTEFLLVDWLNEHHFDYRDLIPMGLALEAPEDMYK